MYTFQSWGIRQECVHVSLFSFHQQSLTFCLGTRTVNCAAMECVCVCACGRVCVVGLPGEQKV